MVAKATRARPRRWRGEKTESMPGPARWPAPHPYRCLAPIDDSPGAARHEPEHDGAEQEQAERAAADAPAEQQVGQVRDAERLQEAAEQPAPQVRPGVAAAGRVARSGADARARAEPAAEAAGAEARLVDMDRHRGGGGRGGRGGGGRGGG